MVQWQQFSTCRCPCVGLPAIHTTLLEVCQDWVAISVAGMGGRFQLLSRNPQYISVQLIANPETR